VPGEGAESKVERFWRAYLETLPEGTPARDETYEGTFGDGPELADELRALVLTGRKTATCFALWEVVAGEETMARVGDRSVILDGGDEPPCVVETTEVAVRRFDEVDDGFAREEGEGDRSLEYWRGAHRRFFERTLPGIGRRFSEDMPLVCERFRVIYN
jgi:uncharacterized protein YhfF